MPDGSKDRPEPTENLSEDSALALLKNRNPSVGTVERIRKDARLLKSRKVIVALVSHQKTPRHVSVPLLRQLFTFDLMQVALTPTVPADVKKAAEEVLIARLESLSPGEKLSLARRASGRVAGVLLLDAELRVIEAALENPHLTEAALAASILRDSYSAALCEAVCRHSKWSLRRDVRLALLKAGKTPESFAAQIAASLPAELVRELLEISNLSAATKSRITEQLRAKEPSPQ